MSDALDRSQPTASTSAAMVPAGYAEKTMASLMQLHSELMEEKERRVDLYRRLMEKEQALSDLRMYVKLLEEKVARAEPPTAKPPSQSSSEPGAVRNAPVLETQAARPSAANVEVRPVPAAPVARVETRPVPPPPAPKSELRREKPQPPPPPRRPSAPVEPVKTEPAVAAPRPVDPRLQNLQPLPRTAASRADGWKSW